MVLSYISSAWHHKDLKRGGPELKCVDYAVDSGAYTIPQNGIKKEGKLNIFKFLEA